MVNRGKVRGPVDASKGRCAVSDKADTPSTPPGTWQFSLRALLAVILVASLAMATVATLRYLAVTLLLPVMVSADLSRRWLGRDDRRGRSSLGAVLVLVFDVTFLTALGVLACFSEVTGN